MTPIPSSDEIIAVLSRSGRQKTKSQVDQDEDVGEDEKIEEIEERDEVEEKEDKGDDEDDSEDPYPAGTLGKSAVNYLGVFADCSLSVWAKRAFPLLAYRPS